MMTINKSTYWMMVGTLLLVAGELVAGVVSHGMLLQKVDDLGQRITRLEQTIDAHSSWK